MRMKVTMMIGAIALLGAVSGYVWSQTIYTSDMTGGPNAAAISALQTAIAGKADSSSLPVPASVAPAMDASSSVIGSSAQYARADHTHPTSVRKTTINIAGGAGKATWNFSPAYAVGIVPICVATPIVATNATQAFIPALSGSPTNTSVTVVVFRTQTQLLSILGVTVNVVATAPDAAQVELICTTP